MSNVKFHYLINILTLSLTCWLKLPLNSEAQNVENSESWLLYNVKLPIIQKA
jgi:hypothetical protein